MSDSLELIQISSDENTLSLPPELCHKMYEKMVTIRRYEEAVLEVYTQGLMRGLAHLYIGQEASAVGICSALNDDDYLTSTHRGHGHLIAKGGKVDRMMAEMMGKVDGYNRGKGGTMHIADMSLGILGANGIVAAVWGWRPVQGSQPRCGGSKQGPDAFLAVGVLIRGPF